MKTILALVALAAAAAAVVVAALAAPAGASPAAPARHHAPASCQPGSQPPESVPVTIRSANGTTLHFDLDGFGSCGESPLIDSVTGPLLVDAASLKGVGCGSAASPCVVFWTGSPQEGQPVGEP